MIVECIEQVDAALKLLNRQIDKAFSEITQEIQALREHVLNGVVPDIEQALLNLEMTVEEQRSSISALDDIVPDEIVEGEPAAE